MQLTNYYVAKTSVHTSHLSNKNDPYKYICNMGAIFWGIGKSTINWLKQSPSICKVSTSI